MSEVNDPRFDALYGDAEAMILKVVGVAAGGPLSVDYTTNEHYWMKDEG